MHTKKDEDKKLLLSTDSRLSSYGTLSGSGIIHSSSNAEKDSRYISTTMLKSILSNENAINALNKEPKEGLLQSVEQYKSCFIPNKSQFEHHILFIEPVVQTDIMIYKLSQKKFTFDSLLMVFANDTESSDESSKRAPFVPCDAKCDAPVKAIYFQRIHLLYEKNVKKQTIDVKCLFYNNCIQFLSQSLSIMLLHHANVINLFSIDYGNDFKEFLNFSETGASYKIHPNYSDIGWNKIDDSGQSALKFAREHHIEERGLFCIDSMEGVDKEFRKSFKELIDALHKLSSAGLDCLNPDKDITKEYNEKFKQFSKHAKQYKIFDRTTDKSYFLYALVEATCSIDKCIQKAIKEYIYMDDKLHYCICYSKEKINFTISYAELGLVEKPKSYLNSALACASGLKPSCTIS